MSGQVSVNSAVEVLLDRGAGYSPRWTVGSGFLLGETRVLTAAHNVGEGEISVRVRRGTEYTATIAQVGDADQGLDLAVVNVTDPSFCDAPNAMVQFAKLNRDSPYPLSGCWAIGFPRFKEKDLAPSGGSRLRDTAQINGEIPLAANLISNMLELRVTATPQASPSLGNSEWEGMSGAVVFCKDPVHGDRAIGVIVEHYQPEGTSSLTVAPITAINKLDEPTARKWWNLLGVVDHQGLPSFPPEPHVELVFAERDYRKQVIEKYKSLDFGGFDRSGLLLTDVPLEEVFVRLSLTVEKVIREPVPPEKSGQAKLRERQQREREITVQEPIELGQALGNHLLIVGEPGAGKSTLLRWLAVTFAEGRQREPNRLGSFTDADRLPVLVELGHLPDRYLQPEGGETPNWLQFLPEYLTTQMAFTKTPPQLLTRALADGRCLLLFDGLDEIADRQARARLARSLAELARLSSGNRVIIGSRPAGISESEVALRSQQFQRCQIERFTPEDVHRFFRFWYALDPGLTPEQQRETADALYNRVQATPTILQLASTPLLSTILVKIWRTKGDLPKRRVELYERCSIALIKQWEAHHEVAYQGLLDKMDWECHLRLLAPLAYFIHSQKQTSATGAELIPKLAEGLQKEGLCSNQDAAIREAELFLKTLSLRSGLLQYAGVDESKHDKYGFPHQTFQEYLTARYIAAQPDPEYINLVMVHLHESWWREVHLLTIGHLGSDEAEESKARASKLILTILQLYNPPSWLLRSSLNAELSFFAGKYLPRMQLARRIAWMLARELELAAEGCGECVPEGITAKANAVLSTRAASLVQSIISDEGRYDAQEALLTVVSESLRRHNNETIVSELLKTLHNSDSDVRQRAAKSLGQVGIGNEMVVSALLEALHDSDSDVRQRAAKSLGQVGIGNEMVVSALLEALHDADYVPQCAAESLERLGVGNEMVVSALLEALHDADSDVRQRAAQILQVGIGNETVVSALLEALHDADSGVRYYAAESLRRLGIGNETVVSTLLEALHDADSGVRYYAAESLGRLGIGNETVVSALLEALHDADSDVRYCAAKSLGQVGMGNETVVSALLEALHDADPHMRGHAAANLGQMGIGNETVVSTLLEALHDSSVDVRARAAKSLGQVGMGNETVVNALLELLRNGCWSFWFIAVKSLERLGVGNETVSSALLEALHDADSDVRRTEVAILGDRDLGNEAVVSPLLEALHDSDSDVRQRAAESLGQVGIGNEAVVSPLLEALHDSDSDVRQRAAESLGRLGVGNETVVSALLEALHDSDFFVSRQVAASLGQLEIKDLIQRRRVLAGLNRCLHMHNGGDYNRKAALGSIRQLLDGRQIPYYHWIPLQKRQERLRSLKRIAILASVVTVFLLVALTVTLLNPASLIARWVISLSILSSIFSVIGVTLRNLLERKESNRVQVSNRD